MIDLPTIGTLETPFQICQDMVLKLGEIQSALKKHNQTFKPAERTASDKKVVEAFELLSSEMDKFDAAYFREIYKDAQQIAALAQRNPAVVVDCKQILKKLEEIFKLLKKAHKEHKRKQHFFVKFAHKMAKLTRKLTKGVGKLEKKHYAMMKKHADILKVKDMASKRKAKIIPFPKKGFSNKQIFKKAA